MPSSARIPGIANNCLPVLALTAAIQPELPDAQGACKSNPLFGGIGMPPGAVEVLPVLPAATVVLAAL
jgi:hypothetical protein